VLQLASNLTVRRLTPLECTRLQGYPDDWLDGLGLADSAKYRMLGNSVAVPCVEWIARRIVEAEALLPQVICEGVVQELLQGAAS
jgi:site-specific DNA-cytosine methylase